MVYSIDFDTIQFFF